MRREAYAEMVKLCEAKIADVDSVILASQAGTSSIREIAESLDWQTKNSVTFAFLNERDGTPIQRLKPLVAAIRNSAAEKLVLGGYEYSVSAGRFLNRRRA